MGPVMKAYKKSAGGNSSKTKKTKECPGCGAVVSLSVRECGLCDYQFTSKSMAVTMQSAAAESQQIRDKFPFEPERVSSFSVLPFVSLLTQQYLTG